MRSMCASNQPGTQLWTSQSIVRSFAAKSNRREWKLRLSGLCASVISGISRCPRMVVTEDVLVGHAGNVIRNHARRALFVNLRRMAGRKQFRIRNPCSKECCDHLLGFLMVTREFRRIVEMNVEISLRFEPQLFHLRRKRRQS